MMKDFKKAQKIVLEMCTFHGVHQEWLTSGMRTKTMGAFRQAVVRRLHKETRLSWREIGLLCGYTERAALSRKPETPSYAPP